MSITELTTEQKQQLIGQQVKVYLNLHKMMWAVKAKVDGKERVLGYTSHITVQPSKFHVGEKTRLKIKQKFEETGKREKNVHAWIVGSIIDFEERDTTGPEISYNPYFEGYYYTREDLKPYSDTNTALYFNAATRYAYKA